MPLVEKIWNKVVKADDPVDNLNIKLKRFKTFFKGWGSHKYGYGKKRKEELRVELSTLEELEEEGPLTHEMYNRKVDINFELHEILVNEEIF